MNTAVFVSDHLAKALRGARLRMPKLIRCRVVTDWDAKKEYRHAKIG